MGFLETERLVPVKVKVGNDFYEYEATESCLIPVVAFLDNFQNFASLGLLSKLTLNNFNLKLDLGEGVTLERRVNDIWLDSEDYKKIKRRVYKL